MFKFYAFDLIRAPNHLVTNYKDVKGKVKVCVCDAPINIRINYKYYKQSVL